MSFDLALWHQPKNISNEDATKIYLALIEEKETDIPVHEGVDTFYRELTMKHPEIDDIPDDDIDDLDLCPWSNAFDRSPRHLIISCVWSKADYTANLIFALASSHNLSVFDPQSETITYPNQECDTNASKKSWWKFW